MVDDLSFSEYLSVLFFSIEFHCTFSIYYKILPYFVCYYSILIRSGLLQAVAHFIFSILTPFFCTSSVPLSYRPSGFLSFAPALLFSILKPLFCPSSSVPLSYFILAVPMRECLGKHSCQRGTSSRLSLVQEK